MIVWPGLRRSVSAISRLFNGASFSAPLTHSAIPTRAASGTTATFTRATTKTFTDHEGVLRTAPAGCAAFTGARFVYNLIADPLAASNKSNDFTLWTTSNATAVGNTVTFGAPAGAGSYIYTGGSLGGGDVAFRTYVASATVSCASGTEAFQLGINDTGFSTYVSGDFIATTTPQRVSFVKTLGGTGAGVGMLVTNSVAGGAKTIIVEDAQLEDITGRTDQTTPSEYVSVGVESAPAYHGSMVDGVKCFDTDLDGNPLPTEYTYDAVSLNGVAGTYVSTPDSVAASITGDIDIRCLNDYQAVNYTPMAKGETNGERSWRFYVEASGLVNFDHFVGGLDAGRTTATSTASVVLPFSGWIRSTVDVDDGAGNHIVRFYTSLDGTAWTQLGADVVVAGVITLFESSSIVAIGEWAGVFFGASTAYHAQIYNGIGITDVTPTGNGTLAVDFDASRYAGGTTLTGSTGETWTLQGNAVIHPTNSPLLGYQAEGARTNLCLQSETLDNASWVKTAATISANSKVSPDGTTTADALVEDNTAASPHSVNQSVAKAASSAAYTFTVYAEKGGRDWVALTLFDEASLGARAWFNVNTGTVGSTANIGAGMGTITTSITNAGSGIWRCSMSVSASGTGVAISPYIYSTDADSNLSPATGLNAVGLYLWGAQVELGSSASSYIATTTIAVARNADWLYYTGGDIPNIKTLSIAATWDAAIDAATNYTILDLNDSGTTTNSMVMRLEGGTAIQRSFCYSGSVLQASLDHTSAFVRRAKYKSAFTVGTNSAISVINGGDVKTDATSTPPVGCSRLTVGAAYAGNQQFFGNTTGIYGWTRNLSQSEEQAVTS